MQKSDGGSFDAATGHKVMANSRGFVGEYRRSYCSLSAMPIAQTEQGGMQRDYWYSSARTLAKLDSPESIGAEAARRTLRRLNARRVPTQRVPIVFAPRLPARSSATSLKRPMETAFIAAPPSGPTSWASRSPAQM
jgi:PmbA protein